MAMLDHEKYPKVQSSKELKRRISIYRRLYLKCRWPRSVRFYMNTENQSRVHNINGASNWNVDSWVWHLLYLSHILECILIWHVENPQIGRFVAVIYVYQLLYMRLHDLFDVGVGKADMLYILYPMYLLCIFTLPIAISNVYIVNSALAGDPIPRNAIHRRRHRDVSTRLCSPTTEKKIEYVPNRFELLHYGLVTSYDHVGLHWLK